MAYLEGGQYKIFGFNAVFSIRFYGILSDKQICQMTSFFVVIDCLRSLECVIRVAQSLRLG